MAQRGFIRINYQEGLVANMCCSPFGLPEDFGKFLCIFCSNPTNPNQLVKHLLTAEIIDNNSPINHCFIEAVEPYGMGDYEFLYEVDFPDCVTTGLPGAIPNIRISRLEHGEPCEVIADARADEAYRLIS